VADRYQDAYRSFRWHVPPDFNIAHYTCARWALSGERLALLWEDESGATAAFTYSQLQDAANRLSNTLAAMGVARGDRVALILPQRPETVITYLACFQMGAIAVPLSFLFGPDALEYRLADSGAKTVVVDAQTAVNFEAVRERLPALAHVIGAAGATVRAIHNGKARSHARRRDSSPPRRKPAIRRPSSTRAARPGHRRARCCRTAPSSATSPASSIPMTASRNRAISSGRPRTGRGPGDCGTR
jgi:acyl-CoA synthetase (AMP-forming)/AMP-acid ligase II